MKIQFQRAAIIQSMFALLIVALLATSANAQTAPNRTNRKASPAIITTLDEVNLDMVVHYKENKPVLDLKPEDVTVTDSGSAVRLSDLRLVTRASSAQHLVTLVFDRLHPSGAKNAHDIVAKILKMIPENGFAFSVLAVGGRLRLFQAFTSDRVALGKAIALATERTEPTKEDAAALPEKNLISVAQTGTDSYGTEVSAEERDVVRMTLASLEESQRIVQDQHCLPSLTGLLGLARTEHQVAAEKS